MIKLLFLLSIIWNDEDLKKINKRDPMIFEKIYFEYKDKILTYLMIKTKGNRELSEELISDTFHSALVSAGKLKNTKSVLGWLIQIANRRFNDYLRKHYRKKKYEDKMYQDEGFEEDKDEVIIKKEKVLLLNTALDNLKPDYKRVLKMMYLEDMPRKEIAKKINKEVGAVQSMLYRAREALKDEINKISKIYP